MENPAPAPEEGAVATAPAVVAVVVTHDPGPWFDDALAALAAQDYPNFAVLVIDAASAQDPSERIAAVLPEAYVRRLDDNAGFGASANHVSEIVEGAAFYCFLHDDAVPRPDAIRAMVDEAVRSNAGIVGTKLVRLDDPRRLLQVGESADKTGERDPIVEPGELDQEQHDAVSDVFVVPGACTLVRVDLFHAIGGFDSGIDLLNDDLNLCWRAHVAGARVIVAPDAVVGHVEALGDRSPVEERRRRLIRHRLRTVLSCYSRWHLIRILPQAMIVGVLEVVYSVLVGRRGQASDVIAAWRWNWRRRDEIRMWRARVEEFRKVPDSEIRGFQIRGSARLLAFLRGQFGRGGSRSEQVQSAWGRFGQGWREGEFRWAVGAWVATVLIVAVGSRHLLLRPVPAVGGFFGIDLSPWQLIREYVSGWNRADLGSASAAPSGLGLLAAAGVVVVGAMGTLRRLLLVGALIGGTVGAYKLLGPGRSPRAQSAVLALYASAPVAYDAMADARAGALAVYALAPWILMRLAWAAGWAPFVADARPFRGGLRSQTVGLALLVALAATVSPGNLVVVASMVAGLTIGSLLAGGAGTGRLLAVGTGGIAGAALLHLPWTLSFMSGSQEWDTFVGAGTAGPFDFAELLRLDVGPVGGGVLGYGLAVAAVLPLLIGEGWRFRMALRCWAMALTVIGLVWIDGRGWLPGSLPPAEAMLVPAVIGLAASVGIGLVSFRRDLHVHGFGWRQVAAILATAAAVLGTLPALLDLGNGRWYLPSGGLDTTFAFFDDEPPGFRVLWLGDPDVLPVPGRPVAGVDGVALGLSADGLPSVVDAWAGPTSEGLDELAGALSDAVESRTARLGRAVAPMGIRFVVVPSAAAPRPLGGARRPAPSVVVDALDGQLDLVEIPVNPDYRVYRNEAAVPMPASVESGDDELGDLSIGSLTDARGVLGGPRRGGDASTTVRGPVPGESLIVHSATADDGWELRVDGTGAPRATVFGWAQGFRSVDAGQGVLHYRTGPLRYLLVLVQLALVVAALRVRRRSRRRWSTATEVAA